MMNFRLPLVFAVAIGASLVPAGLRAAERHPTARVPASQPRATGYLPLDRWRELQQARGDDSQPALPQPPPDSPVSADGEVDRTQQVISRLHNLGGRKIDLPLVDKASSPVSRSYLPLQNWNRKAHCPMYGIVSA